MCPESCAKMRSSAEPISACDQGVRYIVFCFLNSAMMAFSSWGRLHPTCGIRPLEMTATGSCPLDVKPEPGYPRSVPPQSRHEDFSPARGRRAVPRRRNLQCHPAGALSTDLQAEHRVLECGAPRQQPVGLKLTAILPRRRWKSWKRCCLIMRRNTGVDEISPCCSARPWTRRSIRHAS
jgi:hypothetical protein